LIQDTDKLNKLQVTYAKVKLEHEKAIMKPEVKMSLTASTMNMMPNLASIAEENVTDKNNDGIIRKMSDLTCSP